MELLEKQEVDQLIQHQTNPSVSIFISTHIAGKEVLENEDQHKLKAQWDKCRRKLEDQGLASHEIEKIGNPIQELINDEEFWRHQSHGLAIFAAEDFFEYHRLPIAFEDHTYISDHFYVRSLAPALSDEQKFYVLALQLGEVKLFEASEYSIAEIEVQDLVPSKLKDAVGYDYEEKHLQVRNQQQNDAGGSMFHGQGAGNREEKTEILTFFQAVDKGLQSFLHDKDIPLLVFCQDYLFPIYEEANSYQHLYEKPIKGNPNDVELMGLHEKAVETIMPYLKGKKRKKLEEYKESDPTMKNDVVHDILPFAFEGKIDTLFLENRAEIWGNFDEATQAVKLDDSDEANRISLMNLAARKVLEHSGTVYLIDSAFMPSKNAKMNAILRYS
ncbi:MAG: hypothetical protein RIC95_13260 [Vicingaceae bacterium]